MKKYIWLAILTGLLLGCSENTDEDYLKAERTEVQEQLESSTILFYKLFKIILRAQNATTIPPAPHLTRVSTRLMEMADTTQHTHTEVSAQDIIQAYQEYNRLREFALTTNEDTFPTVLETFCRLRTNQTLPAGTLASFGWDNNLEHMALSSAATSARRTEPALYEVCMVQTSHEKDAERACLYRMMKGLVFIGASFPYLSEQEFNQNQQWIESKGKTYPYTFLNNLFPSVVGTPAHTYHSVHGINLVGRGLSRMKMDRDSKKELALQDFEVFLEDARIIGLNDELVWLVTTYVALEKEDTPTAIASLKKLENSPLFSPEDKKIMHTGIEYLQAKEAAKASGLLADKVFMARMCVQYVAVQLKKIDWEKYAGSRPEVKTLLRYQENLNQQVGKIQASTNVNQLKKQGEDWLNKAKDVVK